MEKDVLFKSNRLFTWLISKMTFLPIQFKTKFPKDKFGELNSKEILDEIERWLIEERFNYVERKQHRILFHAMSGWVGLNIRSSLVSGIVKIKHQNEDLIITNGNWMIFLVTVPFLIVLALASSRYSSFDKADIEIVWIAFSWLFGMNLVTRIYAHWSFKKRIKQMVEECIQSL